MSDDLVKRAREDAFLSRATKAAHEVPRAELVEALADEIERLRAENARLREALIDAADMLSGATFEVMRVRGQYIDRKDVVCRARAALQTEGGE